MRSLTRRTALTAAAATAALSLTLTACGSDDGGSGGHSGHDSTKTSASASASAPSGRHNKADVSFAQGMIPHHRQAVEMAGLAASRASSSQVKKLAADIKKAQDPEIRTMSGWLEAWGEDVPEAMPGMDHSQHEGMPGMMSSKDMEELKKASGAAFDTAFLKLMVQHHQGAVEMAGTEKRKGAYGPAKTMADDIIKTQSEEITVLNKLLGKG
ncbi:DUF305 domain-containing protein [Streptomyces sp. ME19-01-6]|uniref:DUF305 domain-containing protein n=1 Tax=Streptomyces sp. ME19-01-6 TaxID=3028686 RepID=UPI0029A1E2E3|nr:DUF305 domain-containing protein [Streptomyces sp. ME19-01-6]MDX3226849.1 DUF305 domain-containing protein [Streptomyces sp. ME19-01-6]